jgi:hypothetical protein
MPDRRIGAITWLGIFDLMKASRLRSEELLREQRKPADWSSRRDREAILA